MKNDNWRQKINIEMNALIKMKLEKFSLIHMIYTIKYRVDMSPKRYKTKLVEKGYTQSYDID